MKKTRVMKISALLLIAMLIFSMFSGCGKADVLDELRAANDVDALLSVCDNFTLSTQTSETNGSYVYTADAFFGRDDIALHEENNFGMGYYYSCAYRGGEAFETDDEVLGYKQYLFENDDEYAESYDRALTEWTADFLPSDGETVVSDVTENGKRVIVTEVILDEPTHLGAVRIESKYTVDEKGLIIESKEIIHRDADGNSVETSLTTASRNSPERTLFDELKAKHTNLTLLYPENEGLFIQ